MDGLWKRAKHQSSNWWLLVDVNSLCDQVSIAVNVCHVLLPSPVEIICCCHLPLSGWCHCCWFSSPCPCKLLWLSLLVEFTELISGWTSCLKLIFSLNWVVAEWNWVVAECLPTQGRILELSWIWGGPSWLATSLSTKFWRRCGVGGTQV